MQESEARRAVAAATAIGTALGLTVDEAIVLHNSNKLTLLLRPADVVARVAPASQQIAPFELEVAGRLLAVGAPVGAPDPRVDPRAYERDGFVVTWWTWYPPAIDGEVRATDYADVLARLHGGMRELDVSTPHFTDRVAEALQLVESRETSPALADADRTLLADTLRRFGTGIAERSTARHGTGEQLLHGEPHPDNVLSTPNGLRFIDLETCCRGPVEFDLAHAPNEVGEHYPGIDHRLLRDCRILMLAMITAWRWDPDDQFPNGHQRGMEWLNQLRLTLEAGD